MISKMWRSRHSVVCTCSQKESCEDSSCPYKKDHDGMCIKCAHHHMMTRMKYDRIQEKGQS